MVSHPNTKNKKTKTKAKAKKKKNKKAYAIGSVRDCLKRICRGSSRRPRLSSVLCLSAKGCTHIYNTHMHTHIYTYMCIYIYITHTHTHNKNYIGLGVVAHWLNLSSVNSA